jgi:hypothetical protein
MITREKLIENLKATIKVLEEMEDSPVLGMTDEDSGYSDGPKPLTYFEVDVLKEEDLEEGDEDCIILHIQYGFED